MNTSPRVDVILSTYNGADFLSEQIESILIQTYRNWRLVIRDDASDDSTAAILNDYHGRYPQQICLVSGPVENKGVVRSFEALMYECSAEYVFFCDQDDVWERDKIALQMERILELEMRYGKSMPVLVHTDLTVVDEELRPMSDSFWKYQHLDPASMTSLQRLLVQNCVTGCAMLINRALLELALPIPRDAIMHDWWLALVAVSEGIVSHVDRQTIRYRQHAKNDTGAKRWGILAIVSALLHGRQPLKASLLKTKKQAVALQQSGRLKPGNQAIVDRYVALYDSNFLVRRFEIIRMGYLKYGVVRNIGLLLRV